MAASRIASRSGDGIAVVAGLDAAMGARIEVGGAVGRVVSVLTEEVVVAFFDAVPGHVDGPVIVAPFEAIVGDATRGRIVDPLGRAIDGGAPIDVRARDVVRRPMVAPPPPRLDCDFHPADPIWTGNRRVDLFARLRRGHRRALYGARGSGKTRFSLAAIAEHARDPRARCIHASIGRPRADVVRMREIVRARGDDRHVTFVAADDRSNDATRALVPFSACAIAAAARDAGEHALLVVDDVETFARAWESFAVACGRAVGLDRLAGWHAEEAIGAILEHAVLLQRDRGGGSLTALVVVDTPSAASLVREIDAAIDGAFHVGVDPLAFDERPRIDLERSTPMQRLGVPLLGWGGRLLSTTLDARRRVARARATNPEHVSDERPDDRALLASLSIDRATAVEEQVVVVHAALRGHLSFVPPAQLEDVEQSLLRHVRAQQPKLLPLIRTLGGLSQDARADLDAAIASFVATFPRA